MQDPEAYAIEGLTAIAVLVQELEQRSERALAGRLEEASKRVLHGLIEIASWKERAPKETAPGHRADPTDLLRLTLGRHLPGISGRTPAPLSMSSDPPKERLKVQRGARAPSRKGQSR